MVTQTVNHLMTKFNNQEPRPIRNSNDVATTLKTSGSFTDNLEPKGKPTDYNTNPIKSCSTMEIDLPTTLGNLPTTLIGENNPPKLKYSLPKKVDIESLYVKIHPNQNPRNHHLNPSS